MIKGLGVAAILVLAGVAFLLTNHGTTVSVSGSPIIETSTQTCHVPNGSGGTDPSL